ncbi:MAG: 16S rRNA (guanine(527)-N(7))-methyltransferase RsmG [Candidatus Cryosericum sp.]|nr:16S rRNA (guanine(527)-N(7))-methyltransferase RsmG [bacterium]
MATGESIDATQLLPLVRASIGEFVQTLPSDARPLLQTQAFASGLTAFLVSLARANTAMNLTADANPHHLLTTHVRDSLAPLLAGMDAPASLLDIGTGGGFPAIPLALAWPECEVTMSESIGKKARFLQSLVDELPLRHARVVHGRVEDSATHLPPHAFAMITARGVAHIATVLQYALPLLAGDGRLVLWKGERDLAELHDPPFVAKLQRLHCSATVVGYALPGIERKSKLVILQMTPAIVGWPNRRNGP